MLIKLFPALENSKILKAINWFFYSYIYIALIAAFTATCCIFGFEMYAFYAYVILGVVIPCLLCKDMTPLLAPLGMAYSSISLKSNNAKEGVSLFDGKWHHLIILVSLIAVFVLVRLIFDLITNEEVRHRKHYLLPGYLVLGLTFVLAGIGSSSHIVKDMLFGLVEFLALFGAYFLCVYLIEWKSFKKDYVLWLLLFYGLAISAEVIVIVACNPGGFVQTGWGINNNIGGQLCICLAAPFYFALKKKASFLYLVISSLFFAALTLTNSRHALLAGSMLFIAFVIVLLVKGNKWRRIFAISATLILVGTALILCFVFQDLAHVIFNRLYQAFDPVSATGGIRNFMGRVDHWKDAWENFLENRSFGTGWYDGPPKGLGPYYTYNFMPGRYHNTFFQLIGSTGVMGLVAYAYHRYQTIRMTFTKPTYEKTFLFLSIVGLLLPSLLDCHLFNFGPGLIYGIMLANIEGINIKENIKVNKVNFDKYIK